MKLKFVNTCVDFVRKHWPSACTLCGDRALNAALCDACTLDLPWLASARCPTCATPMQEPVTCGRCMGFPPSFDTTHASLAYAYPLDRMIQAFKFNGRLGLAPLLGSLLARQYKSAMPDLIIPMPLHPDRLRERGFNQATELARPLAALLCRPLATTLCRREKWTANQSELPWKQRERNIRGAFVCHANLTGETILLVDDVMTSGATLNELAATLKQAGALRVDCCVLARTLPDR